MTATSTAASSLPPVRTSCHVPLSLMTSISEETISLWLKLGALEKLEQAVLDGYGDQLCGKTSRIPQVNKFLKQVPLFQNKIREIHQAVSQGRLRDVQHLIDRKKLAFCRDHNGASPLHKAVIFGHQDVIEYLVKRYAGSIHIRDHQGRTALHYAAFLPDRGEIYQYLLANGADERAMDVYGRQPSYYLDGQNESTLRQLRDGSTLNGLRKIKPRYYGQVSAGQPFTNTNRTTATKSQIRELISDGNINALEDLVLQGQGDRLLGEISSVPKIQSFLNIVPMYMERIYDVHRAVMRDQLEHVVILLENKKLAMARDQLGATPLHKAVLFGHYKIAHYISHQFPDTLNAIDLEGRTALHYAAALKDNKNMYGILIEAGANKGIYDNKGKTADYYAQYPEHLNLEEVIKRCHKVNANYLANTASRIKGKSPVRQTPPPSNGNLSSPRSEENNSSSKDTSQSNDSGNENELISLLQKDKNSKRLDMSSANIRRWVNAKDVEKLTKAVMEGYSEKVVRVNTNEDYEDKEQITGKITEMVDRINAIHSAVSSDDLTELQNQLEERDFALAKDHVGNTPLHKSVLLRKAKIVAYLIEKFPETINAKNKSGLTPLHYAAAMSRKDGLQLYKMLLQAGADPKIRDSHGRTPDYYKTHLITLPNKGMMRTRPAGGRHSETLNRYSKQGVLERMTTALQKGDVELLQDLVLEGHGKHLFGKTSWNEDVKTFLKELPSYLNKIQLLHESIKSGDVEKVKELVASNEKLMRARDESGALPMHIAVSSDSFEVLEFFVKNYPSAINVKDCTGKTALHIASQKGNVGLCKMLKQAGADPKILDQKGKTADFYLQNAKHDGVKMDYDSSKSMLNSSSESSSSIVNAANVRRKSSKDVKSEALVEKTDESVEVAVENEKSLNNDESTESTEAEKEIGENSEERKESLTAAETKDTNENEESEDHATEDQDGEDSNENQTDINLEDEENKEVTTEIDTDADGENVASNETEKSEIESEVPQTSNEDEETAVETEVEQPESEQNEKEDETAETNEIKEDTEINENTRENEEAVPDDENEESQDEQLEIAEAAEDKSEEADENVGNEDGKDDNEGIETTEEDKAETDPTEVNEGAEKVEAEEEENYSEEKTDETNAEDTPEDGEVTNKINEDESAEAAEETNENAENSEPNPEESVNEAPNENNDEKSNVENSAEGVTIADVGSGNTENDNEEKQQNVNENEEENPAESNPEEDTKNSNEDEDEKKEDENETKENETEKEPSKDDVIEENQIEAHESEEKENDEGNVNEKDETSEIKEVEENENDAVEESKDNTTDENKDSDGKENTDSTSKEAEESKDETPQEEIKQVEQDIENAEDSITKSSTQDEPAHHTKDHLDELIEHWIKEGDLLRLEHVVLAGQGDRLIERTSEDKQVQDFLDLVPIYMAKIRAVHEAVAKGQLREVRSVLTRKRFALSRDHVGASPLHLAALHGHTDVSSYIISHFPETMDGPDNEGRTPLHYATALGDNGTLYRLLKTAGADENIEDKAGHSPKYYMSNPGQLTLETLLLPYSTNE